MKGIRTYLSIYPIIYKVIVLIIVPLASLGIAVYLGLTVPATKNGNTLIALFTISGIGVYSEIFGEMFSIGNICAKKRPFGDFVVSSPLMKTFIKRFAVTDALRRVVWYPVLCIIAQIPVFIIRGSEADFFGALVIGLATAAALNLGVIIYRNSPFAVILVFVYLATGVCWSLLAIPYTFATSNVMRYVFALITVLVCALTSFLSARSVIRHSEGDQYD